MQKSLLAIMFTIGAAAGAIGGGAIAASGDQIIETNPHGECSPQELVCSAECLRAAGLVDGASEDALAVSVHVSGEGEGLKYLWSSRWLKSLAPKDVPPNSKVLSYVE